MLERLTLRAPRRFRAAAFSTTSLFALLIAGSSAFAQTPSAPANSCPGDNGGLTLPSGFCATVFADNLGHVRHMAVAPNGVLYVNTWSGKFYHFDKPPAGGFLIALKDSKGTGRADEITRFGDGVPQGSAGGTGIAYYNGAIYAEQNDKIIRYVLPTNSDAIAPTGNPETVVSGLPLTGAHNMHPFIIDAQGHIFVDLGSATNSCQIDDRTPGSLGHNPCTELETRAGTWRYDANKTGSAFLGRGAIHHRTAQWRRLRHQFRRTTVRDAARPRPAQPEFLETLYGQAKRRTARRGTGAASTGCGLRLARMLLR